MIFFSENRIFVAYTLLKNIHWKGNKNFPHFHKRVCRVMNQHHKTTRPGKVVHVGKAEQSYCGRMVDKANPEILKLAHFRKMPCAESYILCTAPSCARRKIAKKPTTSKMSTPACNTDECPRRDTKQNLTYVLNAGYIHLWVPEAGNRTTTQASSTAKISRYVKWNPIHMWPEIRKI